ncbi:BLUF domain-containing protein [Novosphingobium sp. JCM 18896]|uniref:BLUF domain-containing protein n=1 Tax=Novosphingobium sp. JCM 18896 TaxID=2989731 RepID=UPI00222221E6|nr:BLUF domain-containing protein [Novosphingobium sp. JCM 18896]MCW1430291.1 BLUF domain-containing protein [Novosphingobium sp. JCM 18896]
MELSLARLVYYSRNRIAGDALPEIDAILASSRRNNAGAGVTGALLFNMGCFGQILEGPRRAVEATFERIQRDERHGEVSLLDFQGIDERAFSNWSMAFVGSSKLDEDRFADIAGQSGFDPSRMSADSLFEILHSLALEEERRSD